MDELPSEFDIIIVGTGLIESVISAAASRIGKTVLHIDNNNYYGGFWASFNLETFPTTFEDFCKSNINTNISNENEILHSFFNNHCILKDLQTKWHVPEKNENETNTSWSKETLLKESRKFNIDLTPKLHFARGSFVELLISSNIARYTEFRSVSRVLVWTKEGFKTVPCSRADVFSNSDLELIEKRLLMKLFTLLGSSDILKGYENKTFEEFLIDKKLTPRLIYCVLYAIAMGNKETTAGEGIERIKRFLNSIGRYGKTPFLYSTYGSGEIAQAFCRLSAVFGGTYALNQQLNGIVIKNNVYEGIICGKQKIRSKHIVMGADKASQTLVKSPMQFISRAILITNKSIHVAEKEQLTLAIYSQENAKNPIIIIETGSLTGTCPKDLYIVHLVTQQIMNPVDDLKNCIEHMFDDESKSHILWSAHFSIPDINNIDLKLNAPNNLFICAGPDLDLDYEFSIKKAKEMFSELYPEAEFLPRAPDPDEIVVEGEEAVEDLRKSYKDNEKGDNDPSEHTKESMNK